MFGKAAADALGLSDVGKVIPREDFDKVDADDYIFHEEDEQIYFLIKSKADEYCFTNKALIHVDGESAMSKKRLLKRYSYAHHRVSGVQLETAGTVDIDVEIKFAIGTHDYSIDVHKQHLEQVKDLYKTLSKIASLQKENEALHAYSDESIEIASRSLPRGLGEGDLKERFAALNEYVFDWKVQARRDYVRKDFGKVFEMFINN